LHPDLSKAYDLLEVKPGVSNRELKAAHRDLAKVWHPDRFLHDARLQEKAQEKLKEINEAYELLISGKVPNATPSRSAETVYSQPQRRRTNSSQWTAVPLLILQHKTSQTHARDRFLNKTQKRQRQRLVLQKSPPQCRRLHSRP